MLVYVYIRQPDCFTVGHYTPDDTFEPESDHDTAQAAAERVHYLNGGN